VAAGFQYASDPTLAGAPGGSYPARELSCTSCHDPHGRYRRFADGSIGNEGLPILSSGSYDNSLSPTMGAAVVSTVLLGGKGTQPLPRSIYHLPMTLPPLSPRGITTGGGNGDTGWRTAAACRNGAQIVTHRSSGGRGGENPSFGEKRAVVGCGSCQLQRYVASGNMAGNRGTAYTSLVPFEWDGGLQPAEENGGIPGQATAGPDMDANVMCLSCHRAHASGWDHGGAMEHEDRVPAL